MNGITPSPAPDQGAKTPLGAKETIARENTLGKFATPETTPPEHTAPEHTAPEYNAMTGAATENNAKQSAENKNTASKNTTAVLEIEGLTTQLGRQVVHQDLDLRLLRGEILGIIGGSGTGKSVLMRTILGLIQPKAGTIRVFSQVLGQDPASRSELVRRSGVLFQDGALFSSLTVRENIEVPLKTYYPRLATDRRQRIADLQIRLVGLPPDTADKLPAQLSGGMRKRAGLARALALGPELLFLDEPTAGLDPIGAAAFDQLLATLSHSLGLSVFLITHDLDSIYTLCDRVAVLSQRKVQITSDLATVSASPDPWIHDYFHGPRGRAAALAQMPSRGLEQGR